ncbi:hypothetical protein [Pseudomonas alkylphenolica]|uniref:hypothetical protein n=1 Tax=Pseudomonas alkylphenolica TaxID=237609 RepID=UPI0018D8F3B5|nr:hypothetical protein [Pseudomonas alkylphenolica]MBH3427683.1 hypothetical protein [Pseudomonas alkylphenolica]
MPFKALTYDVFHLGLYMVAALAWTTLCVLVLLNARRHMPGVSNASCLGAGVLGAVVCLGLLLADVLRLVEGHVVLFGLIVVGVIVPSLTACVLYFCLSVQKKNPY